LISNWADVSEALGTGIETATRAPWGSKNRTHIVTLADGRRAVWQQYADRDRAIARCEAMWLFGRSGVRLPVEVPVLLAEGLNEQEPWAVFSHLSGEVGYVAAGDDLSGPIFPRVAADMGSTVRAIQLLDPSEFPLPDLWAHPEALAASAEHWLAALAPHLADDDRKAVRNLLASLPALLEGRPMVVAHGDFGPQNVLMRAGRMTGLLDFEDARLADPLLDVAWWAWLVRAHTPAAFARGWGPLLSTARIDASDAEFHARAISLIVCRLLETAEHFRLAQPEKFPSWADRISATLRWPADALVPTAARCDGDADREGR
jgi:aminoglycoside phosphotransferase (APT) family kinase protein